MKNARLWFLLAALLGLAACGAPQVDLTVNLTGDGVGAVTSRPPGLTCRAQTCTGSFDGGTRVVLEAQPNPTSGFTAWGGACTGSSCQVLLDAPKTVTAAFERTRYSLNVTRTGAAQGRVVSTPEGVDCGDDCEEVYKKGLKVSVQAIPDEGALFGGWQGDCSDTGVVCLLELTADRNVIAEFTFPPPTVKSFTVTPQSILAGQNARLEWNVTGQGTVKLTLTPGVGDVTGETSTAVRPSGTTTYTLTAESEFGKVEKKVKVGVEPSAALTVKVNGGGTVQSIKPVNVILDCSRSGGDCTEIFEVGTSVTLQVTEGVLLNWNGCDRPQGDTCTLEMTGDKTVTATFP